MREAYYGEVGQSFAQQLFVLLLDNTGNPVTGLSNTDITMRYLRQGDTSLMTFTLTGSNFTELSDGLYRIDLDGTVTAFAGLLRILLQGGAIDDLLIRYTVTMLNPGNVQVTITVEDAVSTPFPDAQVDIWDNGQTSLLWSGITDSVGQVVVALNPGTYKVLLRRHRTAFTVPETLTVVGPTAEAATFTGTELTIVSPVTPGTCVVYGDIFDITGMADDQMSPESIVITTQKTKTPVAYSNRLYTYDRVDVRADTQGHFEVTLARGLQVKLDIPRVGLEKTFTVPNQASVDITTLL